MPPVKLAAVWRFCPARARSRVSEQLLQASVGRSVVALHGSLPLSEQSEVLRAPASVSHIVNQCGRGIGHGAGCGLRDRLRTGQGYGNEFESRFSSLELTRIAQFNARQRAGRAAREAGAASGCGLLMKRSLEAEQMSPECMRVDLSSALLQLAQLGVSDFSRLPGSIHLLDEVVWKWAFES